MKNNDSIREEMYSYLEKWRATGLDMKAFCKSQNISYYSFKYWKYRQRDEKSGLDKVFGLQKKTGGPGHFLPMRINGQPATSGYIIQFPNGVQLNCPSTVGLDNLSTLIKSF